MNTGEKHGLIAADPLRYIVTSTWTNTDWRVWDAQLRRVVALKVSKATAERIAERLNSGRRSAALFAA